MNQIYAFTINSLQGKEVDFASFTGKVILIVNTASQCGFTYQYEGLQLLHQKYKDQGLVIIGCPCNQFGGQEPGDAQTISNDCLHIYGVNFLITEKIDVNGPESHPLFRYLRKELPGMLGNKVKWNFTKFLIARDGAPLHRFAPITKPHKLEKYIKEALDAK
jgi:glutathione peroxidase